ncbi:MAG: hypothetical protein IJV56_09770 [Neisseriaceae bacterium]|nr:hypothetical protein [Neisseriaceae bacterium]
MWSNNFKITQGNYAILNLFDDFVSLIENPNHQDERTMVEFVINERQQAVLSPFIIH